MTMNQDMKINLAALRKGDLNFLTPGFFETSYLHDIKPNTPDFDLLVEGMIKILLDERHQEIVAKKAEEMARAYFDVIDDRVKILMTQGAAAGS